LPLLLMPPYALLDADAMMLYKDITPVAPRRASSPPPITERLHVTAQPYAMISLLDY